MLICHWIFLKCSALNETHVSGIIAAEADNKQGITGVAVTLDVKIIPIKVLDLNGEGESDIIAKGIK